MRSCLTPRTRIVAVAPVSNALGTITPVARHGRHGASPWRPRAGRRRHKPCRTCRSMCRHSTPISRAFRAQDARPDRHRRRLGPTRRARRHAAVSGRRQHDRRRDLREDRPTCRRRSASRPARSNIADAVGLGAAIDYVERHRHEPTSPPMSTSFSPMRAALLTVPGLRLIGTPNERAGAISFVARRVRRTQDVGKALDLEGIAVRAGHHCAQPILRRFGLREHRAAVASRSTTRPRTSTRWSTLFSHRRQATHARDSSGATASRRPSGQSDIPRGGQLSIRQAKQVIIVGGGASGVLLACHLLRDHINDHVTLIEKRPTVGRGTAYSTAQTGHLLNVRAANMSAFADDPQHFCRWLAANDRRLTARNPTRSPSRSDASMVVTFPSWSRRCSGLATVRAGSRSSMARARRSR